ncbi:NRDE family protein [Natrarchaeobaculum aegyptiacum]|uniref:NRDE family protein n=1 Tax=Natrarchaeobaculum aegyptiacum TaxID=745377 RepID=A0A2Z2HW38_9EURY|nr:NRDE family protein [Natrarchaeobaculum aegyptiacum]ARS91529.1 hypothetical protein B1756_18590 [Natrarchaeobaculum aegyptiacum]
MCTLTLAWQVFEDAPVVVAANRDESLERDSAPPAVRGDDPTVVAPRDGEAGGTWIGANEHGLFAGITNKWNDADLAGERSRGLLVADTLEAESVEDAAGLVEESTAAIEYEGFYLVLADADCAVCYCWNGDLERIDFDPGVHVVVNAAVDDHVDPPAERSVAAREQAENGRQVRAELEPEPGESHEQWLDRAAVVLGDHDYGVCLHRNGFGTRSSSLLAVGDDLEYRFAAGPPCRTTFEPIDCGPLGRAGCVGGDGRCGERAGEGHI